MQSRLRPITQNILLLTVPILVIFIINYLLVATGKLSFTSLLSSTMKISIFVVANALFVILHKYKLSQYSFLIAGFATVLVIKSTGFNEITTLNTVSLYIMNFIYFTLFIGVTYLAYFKINNFKLKNLLFIVGGVFTHTVTLFVLFLINKQPISGRLMKTTLFTGINTYLMVGLALGVALLFFELPDNSIKIKELNSDDMD